MTYLTKTTYLHARQCRKRFWLAHFAPERLDGQSDSQNQAIRQGQEVGRAARACFPGGVLIRGHGEAAIRQTQAAIASGAPAIFEATFVCDGVLIRCDILQRMPDGRWILIEVKSGTRFKNYYLSDLAIQAYVAAGVGLSVVRLEIMHINSKTCEYPDLSNLFHRVDVTADVRALLDEIPTNVAAFQALLAQADEPEIEIGAHCNSPHACPFQKHCWAHVPESSIFTIPRLAPDKQSELIARGILDLRDVPDDFPLTRTQREYIKFIRAGKPRLDRKNMRKALARLQYPLYFFDFETYSPAIPTIPGLRPYQKYPFQYSCHVVYADGRQEHREYLHEQDDDPRPEIAANLIRDLDTTGTIIVYHAQFERSVLCDLAAALPRQATNLRSLETRLWDQLAVIRSCYDHPRFLNSKSIKRVLPVLVPDLSYDDLNVQRGDVAQVTWRRMLAEPDAAVRAELAGHLRAYCERDTFAMVKIHEVLTTLCA